MKRYGLLLVLALWFLGPNSYAQLNISDGGLKKSESQRLLTLQMTYSYFHKIGDRYYFQARTDNQFDNNTWLLLGVSFETVLQTLNDLNNIIDNELTAVIVESEGKEYVISYHKSIGVEQLWIKQEGNAGYSWITKKQLEKIFDYIMKHGSEMKHEEQILTP